jgi:hypothetical protein
MIVKYIREIYERERAEEREREREREREQRYIMDYIILK